MAQNAKLFSNCNKLHSPASLQLGGHMTKFLQWNVNINIRYFQVNPKTHRVCPSMLFTFLQVGVQVGL